MTPLIENGSQEWVIRFVRRRGDEDKYYFYGHHCGITARLKSSMRLTKEVATQFAKAINENSTEWKARVFRYETSMAHKMQHHATVRRPDALKSEEQVELEDLRRENAALKVLLQKQVDDERKIQTPNGETNCQTNKETKNGSEESSVEVHKAVS